MNDVLAILCGGIVGISLGLTGGGGSIFAVPLLIYILKVDVREAVTISLVTVGLSSLLGASIHIKKANVEWKITLLFALTGMLGAPLGTVIGKHLPETLALSVFAFIMLLVGVRMFLKKTSPNFDSDYCLRDSKGALKWSSKCTAVLILLGITVGILSGAFGVGGGFLIVPALALVSGMKTAKAVASSLVIITLICLSALVAQILGGETLAVRSTALFIIGGILGMLLSSQLVKKVNDVYMQKVFAFSMWGIALFMLIENLL